MTIQNPPGWLQNLATHTASQLRTYLASNLAGNYSNTATLRARGGLNPTFGTQCAVTQTGSPSMAVLVESGAGSIPGTLSSTQGNYFFFNDAQVTLSIAAAHATLPRIDIVVVNVRDQQYSGANNDVQLQVITGTPASSPAVPTAPDNSITLAQVAVAAAVTSITNANITDTRFYMAALGGVINSRTEATRPASTEVVEGQLAWAMDVDKLSIWTGSAYSDIFQLAWTSWTPTLGNLTLGNGTVTAAYALIGKTLHFRFKFVLGSTSAVSSLPNFTLPFSLNSAYFITSAKPKVGQGFCANAGVADYDTSLRASASGTPSVVEFVTIGTSGQHGVLDATTPFTFGTGDCLAAFGTVEIA